MNPMTRDSISNYPLYKSRLLHFLYIPVLQNVVLECTVSSAGTSASALMLLCVTRSTGNAAGNAQQGTQEKPAKDVSRLF